MALRACLALLSFTGGASDGIRLSNMLNSACRISFLDGVVFMMFVSDKIFFFRVPPPNEIGLAIVAEGSENNMFVVFTNPVAVEGATVVQGFVEHGPQQINVIHFFFANPYLTLVAFPVH